MDPIHCKTDFNSGYPWAFAYWSNDEDNYLIIYSEVIFFKLYDAIKKFIMNKHHISDDKTCEEDFMRFEPVFDSVPYQEFCSKVVSIIPENQHVKDTSIWIYQQLSPNQKSKKAIHDEIRDEIDELQKELEYYDLALKSLRPTSP